MSNEARERRLQADLEALQALQNDSSILEFESSGEPPDRYTIVFRGRGISRDTSSDADIEMVDLHRCDVRLPFSYPQRPPDVRWLTPVFHPNVSFSGFINLRDLGLTWQPDLGLDVVVERLWEVARLAYLNLDQATNYAAKNYFEDDETELELPLDRRPLRDKVVAESANVVRYERRDSDKKMALPDVVDAEPIDVLYIGEEAAATAEPPMRIGPTRPDLPGRKSPPAEPASRDDNDDDVFYIGDD